MNNSTFKCKAPLRREAKQCDYLPRPREIAQAVQTLTRPIVRVPKESASQCKAYMAAVRKLACYRCSWRGDTQFCHSDEGKGQRIKTDVRLGWPGCGPHYENGLMLPGCHHMVGSTGLLGKQGRRDFEARAGADTRAEIRRLGLWPSKLAPWPGDLPA